MTITFNNISPKQPLKQPTSVSTPKTSFPQPAKLDQVSFKGMLETTLNDLSTQLNRFIPPFRTEDTQNFLEKRGHMYVTEGVAPLCGKIAKHLKEGPFGKILHDKIGKPKYKTPEHSWIGPLKEEKKEMVKKAQDCLGQDAFTLYNYDGIHELYETTQGKKLSDNMYATVATLFAKDLLSSSNINEAKMNMGSDYLKVTNAKQLLTESAWIMSNLCSVESPTLKALDKLLSYTVDKELPGITPGHNVHAFNVNDKTLESMLTVLQADLILLDKLEKAGL